MRHTLIYDSMNRLVKTVDPLNQTNSFAYNDRDQLVTLTDAKGNVTTWAYDALGRQTNKLYAPPGAVPATRKRLGLRQSSGAFHRPRQRQRTAALQDAAAPSAAPPPSVAL